jgi:hypothetical protein
MPAEKIICCLLHRIMLSVQDFLRLLDCGFNLIKGCIRLQRITHRAGKFDLRGGSAGVASRASQVTELLLQQLDSASRMVRYLLGLHPLGFGACQLNSQVTLLTLYTI